MRRWGRPPRGEAGWAWAPAGTTSPCAFRRLPPSLPCGSEPGLPSTFRADGDGKGGVGARPAVPTPPGWEQRQAQAHRRSSVPALQGLLDDRRSAALSARERSPRGARREGIPPPASSCPRSSASRLPKLRCGPSRRGSRARGCARPEGGQAADPASRFPAAAPAGSAPVKSQSCALPVESF